VRIYAESWLVEMESGTCSYDTSQDTLLGDQKGAEKERAFKCPDFVSFSSRDFLSSLLFCLWFFFQESDLASTLNENSFPI
jgi:hypothetical protein